MLFDLSGTITYLHTTALFPEVKLLYSSLFLLPVFQEAYPEPIFCYLTLPFASITHCPSLTLVLNVLIAQYNSFVLSTVRL